MPINYHLSKFIKQTINLLLIIALIGKPTVSPIPLLLLILANPALPKQLLPGLHGQFLGNIPNLGHQVALFNLPLCPAFLQLYLYRLFLVQ